MKILSTLILSAFLFTACVQEEEVTEVVQEGPGAEVATVVLHPTEGNEAEGVVTFTQTDDGVRVEASINGLEAGSSHGFHIHQFGDCRAADGTSAGGHFNPEDMPHGGPDDMQRHVGDLGNLEADENGEASADFTDSFLELNGANSILGRGVIIHAGQDDLESQPTGDAGSRLSCGVIGVANPEQ